LRPLADMSPTNCQVLGNSLHYRLPEPVTIIQNGSWLNMAEIELHVLNGQCLNRHIPTIKTVKDELEAWQSNRNNKGSKINWQFINNDARIKLRKHCPTIHD
jgi:hypothetical protein